jgi:hypothetical protein
MGARNWIWSSLLALGCAAPPPPKPVAAPPPPPQAPLVRVCEDVLPLKQRTIGELAWTLWALDPSVTFTTRPCDAGTVWPIAYREDAPGRPPVDVTLLRMEGDALLFLDKKDRDAPSVKLCAEIDARLGERHRVHAIALWDSGDDGAFLTNRLQASHAELAWIELRSRAPSGCATGKPEVAGQPADPELRARWRCAMWNYVQPPPEGCPLEVPASTESPDADAVARTVEKTHRYTFAGRDPVRDAELVLERPERCVHEPAPATHDICFASYRRGDERWYGRGEVTRTGTGGEKNYVDSYLTLQLLKRLEAERRSGMRKAKEQPPAPKK